MSAEACALSILLSAEANFEAASFCLVSVSLSEDPPQLIGGVLHVLTSSTALSSAFRHFEKAEEIKLCSYGNLMVFFTKITFT